VEGRLPDLYSTCQFITSSAKRSLTSDEPHLHLGSYSCQELCLISPVQMTASPWQGHLKLHPQPRDLISGWRTPVLGLKILHIHKYPRDSDSLGTLAILFLKHFGARPNLVSPDGPHVVRFFRKQPRNRTILKPRDEECIMGWPLWRSGKYKNFDFPSDTIPSIVGVEQFEEVLAT
jgi:hypothetical protein